jgi:hypothetical protein
MEEERSRTEGVFERVTSNGVGRLMQLFRGWTMLFTPLDLHSETAIIQLEATADRWCRPKENVNSMRRFAFVGSSIAALLTFIVVTPAVVEAATPRMVHESTPATSTCASAGFCAFDLYINGANSSPPGWGTVAISPTPTSNPDGPTESTCSNLYVSPCYVGDWSSSQTITLTAEPTTGNPSVSYFTGWSGACSGSSLTCTFSLPYQSQATCTGGVPSDPPGAVTVVCATFSGSPPCGNTALTSKSQSYRSPTFNDAFPRVTGSTSCSPKKTSGTWSGYYAWTTKPFTYITTTFVQPKMTCPAAASEPAETNIWVGFDGTPWIKGASSGTVEQAGTEAFCTATGNPTYSAWYEMFGTSVNNGSQIYFDGKTGAGHSKPNIALKPGDQITVTVSFSASTGKYTLSVSDAGPVGSVGPPIMGTAVVACSRATCKRGSAEWIVERRSDGPGGLAKWGNLEMQNDLASTTVPATPSSISSFKHYGPITMLANDGTTVMAKPAGLTNVGKAFAVTFKDSGP